MQNCHSSKYFILIFTILAVFSVAACVSRDFDESALSEREAEAIAYDAYVFNYPTLQNFKTLYLRTVMQKYPINKFAHRNKLLDPSFTTIVAPNNDTLYSASWLDLRSEPIVISVPEVPSSRYYSLQFIDLFTHNFAYIGQRATGSKAGSYAIVGPSWQGEDIAGVDDVFRSESDLVFVIGRILAKNNDDVPAAIAIQQQYQLQGLSEFSGYTTPASVAPLMIPDFSLTQLQNSDFVKVINYLLQYVRVDPSEDVLFQQFEKIGIAAGKARPFESLSDEIVRAIERGVQRAISDIDTYIPKLGKNFNGWTSTLNAFGARDVMAGRYMVRAAAAKFGLYGHSDEENSSYIREVDETGEPLDTSKYRYTLTFSKGNFPPARAFWSLSMYRMPEVLFYANDIGRYSIGDRTPGVTINKDGSMTIYIQNAPVEDALVGNWLPAPAGEFALGLRVYLPKPEVYEQRWQPPTLRRFPLGNIKENSL